MPLQQPKSMHTAGGNSFPKNMRLLHRSDYVTVQNTGRAVHGRYFLAVAAPYSGVRPPRTAGTPERCGEKPLRGRIGVTVSKKVGNAVARNRIKRLVREYIRQREWNLAGRDIVIIAKRGATSLSRYRLVAAELSSLGARMGILARNQER